MCFTNRTELVLLELLFLCKCAKSVRTFPQAISASRHSSSARPQTSLGPFRGGICQELYLVEDLLLLALLSGQGKCHVDFCPYIDRLAINRRGLVAPLLHRLDRRWREQRVARSHILHRNDPALPHWVEKPWVASQAVLKLKDLMP